MCCTGHPCEGRVGCFGKDTEEIYLQSTSLLKLLKDHCKEGK